MSAAPKPKPAEDDPSAEPPKKAGKKKLILIAAPVLVLLLGGAGLWVTGILPNLLGSHKEMHGEGDHGGEHGGAEAKRGPPAYVELPEMVANLNGTRKPAYIKVVVRIEVPKQEDVEKVKAAIPRLQDMFQTYLREIRPEELRGSAGTYRLREELIARANIAVAPNTVSDVLFTQMLVQ
ncbi:flagellar basal body-associated FliL family protein [Rhodopila sp.]|uniref:flagellar basal body-associated FliL family protein n=1 Tax=Rhodopila sp. TaxID=2480087 RepID=UPI002D0CE481|nr:flagellar basal body-associated FliL family protein [Rhodopila sp.]HVZ06817.1 flagellar basal body-associated FliL family protein [Rhodopila sp.]